MTSQDDLAHYQTTSSQQCLHLARVYDRESHHDDDHEKRIEDICGPFIRIKIGVHPHCILDQPEDTADEDQHTSCVDVDQMLLPREVWELDHLLCLPLPGPHVEDDRYQHKQSEEHNLDRETNDDDLVPKVRSFGFVG